MQKRDEQSEQAGGQAARRAGVELAERGLVAEHRADVAGKTTKEVLIRHTSKRNLNAFYDNFYLIYGCKRSIFYDQLT